MQRGGGRSRRLQVSSCHQHGAVRMQRGGAPVRAGVGRVPQSPRARRRRPEWPACRAGLRRAAKEARAACCVCVRAIYECEEKVAGSNVDFLSCACVFGIAIGLCAKVIRTLRSTHPCAWRRQGLGLDFTIIPSTRTGDPGFSLH